MSKWGIALVALVVGCAAGVVGRTIEFPARAAGNVIYGYKIVKSEDLMNTVRKTRSEFKDAENRDTLEEGMRGFGAAGWRYAGCLQTVMGSCSYLLFESSTHAEAAPPPGRTPAPAVQE